LKISKNPADLMIPFPVTLMTCRDSKGIDNIVTTAWIGILNPKPPMIGICMHESRYSTPIIEESGEFVVNFPSDDKLGVGLLWMCLR
jgi:flavin reductase (DIM6/NTAB) family NADH-FMN oxidoreductase RutF